MSREKLFSCIFFINKTLNHLINDEALGTVYLDYSASYRCLLLKHHCILKWYYRCIFGQIIIMCTCYYFSVCLNIAILFKFFNHILSFAAAKLQLWGNTKSISLFKHDDLDRAVNWKQIAAISSRYAVQYTHDRWIRKICMKNVSLCVLHTVLTLPNRLLII